MLKYKLSEYIGGKNRAKAGRKKRPGGKNGPGWGEKISQVFEMLIHVSRRENTVKNGENNGQSPRNYQNI